MIKYIFKIDTHDGKGLREIKTKPFAGNSDVRKLNEELDSGFMIILLKNKENLPIMSYVEYTIQDDNEEITKKFYISRDVSRRISKNKHYYQHNIELIELTKKLEKYIEATICFTQPTELGEVNYTLKDCIERIIRIFPLGEDKVNSNFIKDYSDLPIPNGRIIHELDEELKKKLENIFSPQFVFNNPTLREALDGVLKYVNAVVRLENYEDILNENAREYYDNILNTVLKAENIEYFDEAVIRIKATDNNDNFVIKWDDKNTPESYTFAKIEIGKIYEFKKIYHDTKDKIIKIISDYTYELIGDSVNKTPSCYLKNKQGQIKLIIPLKISGIESLGEYAFYSDNLTYIDDLYLTSGLKKIYQYAFYNVVSYNEINFPSTLDEIGEYAFNTNYMAISSEFFFNSVNSPKTFSNSFSSTRKLYTYESFYNSYYNSPTFYKPIQTRSIGTELIIKVDKDATNLRLRPHIRIIPQETTDDFRVYWDKNYTNYESYSVEEGREFFLRPSEGYSDGIYTIVIPKENKYYFEGHLDKENNNVSAFWKYCEEIEDTELESDYTDYIHIINANLNSQDRIGKYSFKDCTFLESVEMSNEIQTIEEGVFYWCTSLNEVKLSSNVTIIEESTFYNCTNLKEIEFSEKIKNIKENSFLYSGLQEIIIPFSVRNIGSNSFRTNKLIKIFIPSAVYMINSNSFYSVYDFQIYIIGNKIPNEWSIDWTNTKNIYFYSNEYVLNRKINGEFYGHLKDLINKYNTFKEEKSQTIESYAIGTNSFAKNISTEIESNKQILTYPQYGFGTFKSRDDEYSINDTNFGILTEFPIKKVLSIYLPVSYEFDLVTSIIDISPERIYEYVTLKIEDNILEEEVYNKLSLQEKMRNVYYKKGDNFIVLNSSYKHMFFPESTFIQTIFSSIAKDINEKELLKRAVTGYLPNFKVTIYDNKGEVAIETADDFEVFHTNGQPLEFPLIHNTAFQEYLWSDVNIMNIGYKVDYIPEYSSRVEMQKINTEDSFLYSTQNAQQEDRIISFDNFANTLFSLSQRTGNKNLELTCQHFVLRDLINIGDYTEDGYVCTTAEYIYYNNYIIANYSFDKNYNRISSYMGINADIRQYELPSGKDSYERQCKIDKYVEIGYNNTTNDNLRTNCFNGINNYIATDIGAKGFNLEELIYPVKSVFYSASGKYAENSALIREWEKYVENPCILLSTVGKGAKNVISFDFGFKNNITAGEFAYYDETESKILKQPIPYCNPSNFLLYDKTYYVGFLRNLRFSISNGNGTVEAKEKIPLLNRKFDDWLTNNESQKDLIFYSKELMVLKDPSEILQFTLNIHFIPKDKEILLGHYLFENSSIFGEGNIETKKYRMYFSREEYNEFNIYYMKEELPIIYEWENAYLAENVPLNCEYVEEDEEIRKSNKIDDFYIYLNNQLITEDMLVDVKNIVITDEKNRILLIIKNSDRIFEPIYFNFKDRRSDIKYEY